MKKGETRERTALICDKIIKKTGLDPKFLMWYIAFNEDARPSNGIIIPDEVKYDMQNVLWNTNRKPEISWEEYTKIINEGYDLVVKIFEKKGLIDYKIIESGHKYPVLKGYNYLNDPEFYISYRKKGDIEWYGRMSTPLNIVDILKCVSEGNEFREKDITANFFN